MSQDQTMRRQSSRQTPWEMQDGATLPNSQRTCGGGCCGSAGGGPLIRCWCDGSGNSADTPVAACSLGVEVGGPVANIWKMSWTCSSMNVCPAFALRKRAYIRTPPNPAAGTSMNEQRSMPRDKRI